MKTTKRLLQIKEKPDKIYCNKCGKLIEKNESGYFADYLDVQKEWGYFSAHDGEKHYFDLCQHCYQEFIASFALPVDIRPCGR
jgi:ribosomal-protein-alanine N-acetyltransferase